MSDTAAIQRTGRGVALCRRLAALALLTALVGLPINHLFAYALLFVAAGLLFTGEVTARPRAWLAAAAIFVVAMVGKWLVAPPWIEEGHNVFLAEHADALKAGLPDDVYTFMAKEFDAQYPPAQRCNPDTLWCWRGTSMLYYLRLREADGAFPTYRRCVLNASNCLRGFPQQAFAFSADGIFQSPRYSRRVTSIDFSDPAWLRLGFLNDGAYNWWNQVSDVKRAVQERWTHGIHRWRVTMPWFVMYQFPAAYSGSRLCWRGDVLWEKAGGGFEALHHDRDECRVLTPADTGRRIFGVAIKPDTLAMHLDAAWRIKLAHWARAAFDLAGVFAVLVLLVRPHWRRMVFPLVLIAIAAAIIAAFDLTTFGGLRAQEGGNDGLFYDAAGRVIVQHLVAGDVASALEGTEPVYYYGGPGLRYLRALEMIVFGDTNLGYLSLLLVYPLVIWRVFRRFLPTDWAFVLLIMFVATPIGAYFGSTFFLYVKYALQGFGDPVSYLFYLAGLAIIVGWPPAGPGNRFGPACAGAALLFLATFVRPIVAPGVAVLLGGAGLAALWQRQWSRLAGLCAGFVPVLAMPLHNWYFGDRLVLFSANASGNNLHVTPADYVAALAEMSRLNFAGPHVHADRDPADRLADRIHRATRPRRTCGLRGVGAGASRRGRHPCLRRGLGAPIRPLAPPHRRCGARATYRRVLLRRCGALLFPHLAAHDASGGGVVRTRRHRPVPRPGAERCQAHRKFTPGGGPRCSARLCRSRPAATRDLSVGPAGIRAINCGTRLPA